MRAFVSAFLLAVFIGCGGESDRPTGSTPVRPDTKPAGKPVPPPARDTRKTVKTIHVFVALCDNATQGIVPVSRLLGNGDDPRNNLYWGAMYGTRTFLKRSGAWDTIATVKGSGKVVLERIVLKHRATGAYLVADAYRGSRIKDAVESFLIAAAGNRSTVVKVGAAPLGLHGKADMVVYVGHNGLMDFRVTPPRRRESSGRPKAAIVLACRSRPYFRNTLASYGCKPMLLTTNLMAPEAYTLHGAIEAWLSGHGAQGIRARAALAYNKYQKCGIRGATRLFHAE